MHYNPLHICPILVFSDLDGTLLDHDTYSFEAALPALTRLQKNHIPLILNSSKTRPEMERIQARLQIHTPFIVENGAAVVIPARYFGQGNERVIHLATPISDVLAQLQALRKQGYRFKSFNDMSAGELADETGLTVDQAAMAKHRMATEPMLWQGNDSELEHFENELKAGGLQLIKGGRFYHVMGQYDKQDAMTLLVDQYRFYSELPELTTIALGDSPNDKRMLEAADHAVVVKGVNSDKLIFAEGTSVLFAQGTGPEGWNEVMQSLLDKLLAQTH